MFSVVLSGGREYFSSTFSGGNVPNKCHKSIPFDARAEDESSDVKHERKSCLLILEVVK